MGFNVSSSTGALGRNRTCDLRFRKPLLYPLSYEGGGWCEMWCEIRRHICITINKASAAPLQKDLFRVLLGSCFTASHVNHYKADDTQKHNAGSGSSNSKTTVDFGL